MEGGRGGGGASEFWICLTFDEFRIVYLLFITRIATPPPI